MSKAEYYMIKGVIADLPEADRVGIQQALDKLRSIVEETGDQGRMALALLTLEFSVADEK